MSKKWTVSAQGRSHPGHSFRIRNLAWEPYSCRILEPSQRGERCVTIWDSIGDEEFAAQEAKSGLFNPLKLTELRRHPRCGRAASLRREMGAPQNHKDPGRGVGLCGLGAQFPLERIWSSPPGSPPSLPPSDQPSLLWVLPLLPPLQS